MSVYKLYTAKERPLGMAETLRLVFTHAKVEFEDIRVSNEDWSKMKPNTPTGTLPMLEVDGVIAFGGYPILRFLGERFGFAGDNDIENLQIAALYDVLQDLIHILIVWYYETDEQRKASLVKAMETEHIPRCYRMFEKKCMKNNTDSGWIFGSKVTYLDFAIYGFSRLLMLVFPGSKINSYLAVKKLRNAVEHLNTKRS